MAKKKTPAHLTYRFDDDAPEAVAAAEKNAAKRIVEISKATERNIKGLIADAIRDGVPPYEASRNIVTMIGLTAAQGQAVSKYREELIDSGLTLEKVNDKVDDYSDELLSSRGDTIARTEILDALNTGQEAAWEEAQALGYLSEEATKVVILAGDACPFCEAIAKQGPVPLGESFSEDGPPFHPRCRCSEAIQTP